MDSVGFKQRKGCFVPRWALILSVGVGLLLVLAVGLLAGLWSCSRNADRDEVKPEELRKPLPYVRLPRSVAPEHYDIELQPFLVPGNFTFRGSVSILVRFVDSADNITLHAHTLTIDSYDLEGCSRRVSRVSEDKEKQFFVLHLDGFVGVGQSCRVKLDYTGILNDQLHGFYRSSYQDDKGKTRWLATTQFQPTDARRAFPCFDEPGLKATFNVTLVRPSDFTSISNMPLMNTESRGDGWAADHFQKSVRMSTYLMAFVVCNFKKNGNDDKTFSVWSRAQVLNTTSYALQIGPAILRFFDSFFQVKYPLPKMDMVAIPDFSAGAMENWGLILYRETSLLYDPRYSSALNKQRVATVISHELAHQWFGNLVTPRWWDDLWLNEGFASYVEYLGVNAVHPEWRMEEQFVLDDLQDVLDLDCLRTSHPISLPVRHPDEINEIFDRISYGKGASLIRMMKFFLGDENFKRGLMNYLNAKKFDNAAQDDLWQHLSEASPDGIKVKEVMDSWTLQTGYPVVLVTRDYGGGTARVEQYRFLLEEGEDKDKNSWEVPFTFTDSLNPDWTPRTKLWLNRNNGSLKGLPGRSHWIIGNVQEVGYYRVHYDEQNWKLLVEQLQRDHKRIHTVNRAQIIDDALDLARAGQLSYSLALNTTLYLRREEEYLPLKAALNAFAFIDTMICRSAVYGKWKDFLIEQLKPSYEALGWDEKPEENILMQYKRSNTLGWMCRYGHADCVEKAKERFDRWREDPNNTDIVPPNLRNLVYCKGVEEGGEDAWNFVWERYKTAQIASEKSKFMYALACAREPWLLTRYLNWSLNEESGIRRQDGGTVFRTVGAKLYGRDLTFNYMRDKWTPIISRYGKSFFAINSIVKTVATSLNTQFELTQLTEFYEVHKDNLGTAKRSFEQSLEEVKGNVQWMEANYPHLVAWLDGRPS